MKLILVRHGETEWNNEGKLLSKTDISLNEKGLEQAKKTANKLKNLTFDFIYTSNMKRTLQTVNEINKYHNVNFIQTELLQERNYGDFEGVDYHKLDLRKIRKNNLYKNFNMETPEEFRNRIKYFLKNKLSLKYNQTILIVSHSGTIKKILYYLLKIKEPFDIYRKQFIKYNSSISTIEFNKNLEVINSEIANDEHLKK